MPTPESPSAGEETVDRAARESKPLSVGQLAHELNSLLDGSLRSIRLAERALSERPEDDARQAIIRRLQTAQQAMGDIAVMLERAMSRGLSGVDMLRMNRSLGEEIEFVVAALASMAERGGVSVSAKVAPEAGQLPAGALGALLMNAARNAIEASAAGDDTNRVVELSVGVSESSELLIEITDSGPGPGPGPGPGSGRGTERGAERGTAAGGAELTGHGLGLAICRAIVADLGGALDLRAAPGGGALFVARVPLGSVRR